MADFADSITLSGLLSCLLYFIEKLNMLVTHLDMLGLLTGIMWFCRKKIKKFLGKTVQKIKTVADEGMTILLSVTALCRCYC